jgi:acid phosphatase
MSVRRHNALAFAAFLIVAIGAHMLNLTPTRKEVSEAINWARYAVAPPVVPSSPVPSWSRVYVIVLENRDWDEIFGSSEAPYLNELAARGAIAINTWDVADGSQANYLAMTSGSTHFVTDNGTYDIDAPSIFDQLEEASRTWRVYAEQIPPGCFIGAEARGGRDGRGEYTRAHNPAISFDSIREAPERCANIQDFAAFDPLAADFSFIVPDSCHNTHDCPVSTGDRWLSEFVPQILDTPDFWRDSLLVITFDGGTDAGENQHRIAVTMVGAGVKAGTVSETRYEHYNVLRTLQSGLGLPCLARSCKTDTMADLFVGGIPASPAGTG